MVIKHPPVPINGTTGGIIPVSPDLTNIQISVSGRATGVLTFTGKSSGSDVYEAFQPAITMDLSVERTEPIIGYSLESLSVTPDVAGSNFDVTISQWYTQ